MPETITIIDNRTGNKHQFPVTKDTTTAAAVPPVRMKVGDPGLMTCDPSS